VALGVLGALLLTRSRGALVLGLPAALLGLGLLQRNRRALWVSLAALVVLALLLLPLGLGERLLSLLRAPAQGTTFFRLKLWRSTLTMIANHPLRGVGLDGFLYAYRSRYVLPSAWGELNLSHPHNLLLDTWTRLGLWGVVVVGWLLYWFFRLAWSQFREALGYRRALLLGAMAAMIAAVGHGMVDQTLYTVDLAFVFMVLLALVQG
jgi:O-antigen ligase